MRHVNASAGVVELPAVISAFDLVFDDAPVAEPHEPVRTAILQRAQLTVAVSKDDDGLAPNLPPERFVEEVRRLGDHVPAVGIDAGAADVAVQLLGGSGAICDL